MACKVVMRYTPHSTKVEIHVAGEEKKVTRYGDVSQVSNANPPNVNRIEPQNLRRRSASLRSANRTWKRSVKPARGETTLIAFNAIPVSANAEQYAQVRRCESSSRFCSDVISLSFNNQSSKGWCFMGSPLSAGTWLIFLPHACQCTTRAVQSAFDCAHGQVQ